MLDGRMIDGCYRRRELDGLLYPQKKKKMKKEKAAKRDKMLKESRCRQLLV